MSDSDLGSLHGEIDATGGAAWSRRQSEVLDDLGALILTEGFRRLTIADLADRLRCSRRTLYSLATSRDELVSLAVECTLSSRLDAARTAASAAGDGVAAVVASMRESVVGYRPSATFVADIVADEWVAAAEQRFRDDRLRDLATLIDRIRPRGRDVPSAAVLAHIVEAAAERLRDERHDSRLTEAQIVSAIEYVVVRVVDNTEGR